MQPCDLIDITESMGIERQATRRVLAYRNRRRGGVYEWEMK